MNNVSPFAVQGQEGSSAQSNITGVNPEMLKDLIHELRQPLSVIESLAYYLEMTSTDKNSNIHLQKIRIMLAKAHAILERSSLSATAQSALSGGAGCRLIQEH
jgi:signal transduction histidine kinase